MKTFFSFLCIIVSINSFGQVRTITARIVDAETKKPIANVLASISTSDTSTYSNYLGYFQLELNTTDTILIVSHIAYENGSIIIPKQDKFTFSLNPNVIALDTLFLSHFPKQAVSASKQDAFKGAEKIAFYKPGWPNFYTHLGNKIVQSKNYSRINSSSTVQFQISSNGVLSNIEISSDSTVNKSIFESAFSSINLWNPATQNGEPIDQNFKLIISNKEPIIEFGPQYPEGMQAFYIHIQKGMKYPAEARKYGIQGKVFVQFQIDEEGNVIDVKTIRGIGGGCDEEAERIIKLSPKWEPGTQNNKPVKVRMVLPITFKLS